VGSSLTVPGTARIALASNLVVVVLANHRSHGERIAFALVVVDVLSARADLHGSGLVFGRALRDIEVRFGALRHDVAVRCALLGGRAPTAALFVRAVGCRASPACCVVFATGTCVCNGVLACGCMMLACGYVMLACSCVVLESNSSFGVFVGHAQVLGAEGTPRARCRNAGLLRMARGWATAEMWVYVRSLSSRVSFCFGAVDVHVRR
jgi:hypothetical protein